ncbi:HVA22-like protein j isoform X2 [Carica papaya]|uniref:HVA22-like protein j isoform X2 n=1 Tax=Carica papaya TaxID=3649 RepID=UPI000B8C8A7A|nr:HVA22-like protein j isoform X2 [Carica papaya]
MLDLVITMPTIIFGILVTILEKVGDVFLSWLPMYGLVKMAVLICLWHPTTQKITAHAYENLLRPCLAKHEKDIDGVMKEFGSRGVRSWLRLFGELIWKTQVA